MKFCNNTNFTLLNNPKDLDPSYKMDLDLGLFWKEKTLSYNRRNTVIIIGLEETIYNDNYKVRRDI